MPVSPPEQYREGHGELLRRDKKTPDGGWTNIIDKYGLYCQKQLSKKGARRRQLTIP
jgi:hypothetical protein